MSITQEVHKLGKPIYAFDNTSKDQSGESHVYPAQNPEMMVEEIKSYLPHWLIRLVERDKNRYQSTTGTCLEER